jgi:hypothetical protein
MALVGCTRASDAARRLGVLSSVDALASAAGVQFSLLTLSATRWADGGQRTFSSVLPTTALCVCAASLAVGAYRVLGALLREHTAAKARELDASAVQGKGSHEGVGGVTILASLFGLSVAVAVPSVALQAGVESLGRAPSILDGLIDAALRVSLQSFAVSRLCTVLDTGPKGAALVGGALLGLGTIVEIFTSSAGEKTPLLALHQLMVSSVYVMETAAATLVALGAAACAAPAARRVTSLIALHTAITLAPALLPSLGGVGGGPVLRKLALLLPSLASLLLLAIPRMDLLARS